MCTGDGTGGVSGIRRGVVKFVGAGRVLYDFCDNGDWISGSEDGVRILPEQRRLCWRCFQMPMVPISASLVALGLRGLIGRWPPTCEHRLIVRSEFDESLRLR